MFSHASIQISLRVLGSIPSCAIVAVVGYFRRGIRFRQYNARYLFLFYFFLYFRRSPMRVDLPSETTTTTTTTTTT
jgi:hypothetical protein